MLLFKLIVPRLGKSSLMMVNVAVVCVPKVAPPWGLVRVKLMVSSGSNWVSLTIEIVTVLVVSPLAKLTVIGELL